jgi:hypothetical protein
MAEICIDGSGPPALGTSENEVSKHSRVARLVVHAPPLFGFVNQERDIARLPIGIQPCEDGAHLDMTGHRPGGHIEARAIALKCHDVPDR